jgi:MFS transporter, ACS family, glucarate transporter
LKHRYWVLILLAVVAVITYLDRVCIAVAGPRMQSELRISPAAWGWVVGIFAFAYAAFEIPTGSLADRYGSRKVLTRIVLWWSVFTSLTGFASSFPVLLAIRFFFGVGEAGALPNFASSISRWFPVAARARILGTVLLTTQLGGALSPLLVVPIQARYGWRASFYLFGILGVLWAIAWYGWYRDNPHQKPGVSQSELEELGPPPPSSHQPLAWRAAIRSKNLWLYMLQAFAYYYVGYFFVSWLHTFLVKGRGFGEKQLLLSTFPFLFGACGNLAGGFASDVLVRKLGLKWGRSVAAASGAGFGALALTLAILVSQPYWSLFFLSLTYMGMTFIQPAAFAVAIDIAPRHAGAIAGAMNTAAQTGAFVSSLVFGYLVKLSGNYSLPLIPMVLMFLLCAITWLKIDATEPLVPET